ncbi:MULTISPECIES: hypothetical protein [Actinoalloteichus]|nr:MULTISPECIES: hypothetical protein [Actinoalloteichus]
MRSRIAYEVSNRPGTEISAVFRGMLVETRDDGSRWTTTVRSWAGDCVEKDLGGQHGWIWVDVEAVSYESLDDVTVAAPKFVRTLLSEGVNPTDSDVLLSHQPREFVGADGAEELAELITSMGRVVPVVVFTPLPRDSSFRASRAAMPMRDRFDELMVRAAGMAAGLALITLLDETGVEQFNLIMGDSYAVRDGAFRIYEPGVDPALDEGWRHRYTLPTRFLRYRQTAGQVINRAISLRAGARRAPASFEFAERMLNDAVRREPAEWAELITIAEEESAELRTRVSSLDQRYLDLLDEQYQLEGDNNRLRAELGEARRKLALAEPALWRDKPEAMQQLLAEQVPASADSPTDAILLAQEHLNDRLCLPAEACAHIAHLDNAVEARAWGETSWRAFLALHAYAVALVGGEAPGTFWTWCETSGHPAAWPATTKKLAMKESETVRNSTRLWSKREFIVDRRVSPSGRIYMEAHIKIATGGGPLAPRIYFHPSRETGMVHIGYYGPHRNVPNTLT